MATAASGMHPTGMHSFSWNIFASYSSTYIANFKCFIVCTLFKMIAQNYGKKQGNYTTLVIWEVAWPIPGPAGANPMNHFLHTEWVSFYFILFYFEATDLVELFMNA